jgi:two-component system sensor histidine kinase QseC
VTWPRSIQGRLIVALTAAAAGLSLVVGVALYRSIRSDLIGGFDRALEAQASAVRALVSVRSDGSIDFDYSDDAMPVYRGGGARDAQYFFIRGGDGRVFARSGSLRGIDWSPDIPAAGAARDVALPGGRAGRALRVDFVPALDEEGAGSGEARRSRAAAAAAPVMTIVVARDRGPLDESLGQILRRLAASGVAFALATAAAVVLIVRRSLRPLRDVADAAREIGPAELHRRLPEAGLPAELLPISARVNELLGRLGEAFARERRFTSDVAHELRTPIAELRAVTEVALRWPDDGATAIESLRDAHQIAGQMQTLVATLLALVRVDRGAAAEVRDVALAPAVTGAARELRATGAAAAAAARGIEVEVPGDAVVSAEPALLASVLRNVLSNALEYRDAASPVRCAARRAGPRWVLSVENGAPGLSADDLAHLFEPFWRKDAARSDPVHAGLGLALVRAYCGLMGAQVRAELVPPATLRIELSFAAGEAEAENAAERPTGTGAAAGAP